jgi:hypothetical protein
MDVKAHLAGADHDVRTGDDPVPTILLGALNQEEVRGSSSTHLGVLEVLADVPGRVLGPWR